MDIAIWLIGGAIVGAIAAKVIGTDKRQSLLTDVLLGMGGAVLTGLVILPVLGAPSINMGHFSAGAAVVALIGALAVVVIGNAVRKRWARTPR